MNRGADRGANWGGLHWSRSLRFRLLAVTVAGLTVAVVLAVAALSAVGFFATRLEAALAAHFPEQFAKVKANPALIPGLIEESIRWVTPVKHFMRTATADAELAGKKIAKGDWMMLSYPSGNRDEAVFADPFKFDVERTPNKHVAFGYGAHVCLGQHLARMEMRVLWEELLPRLESVELDGTPRRMEAAFVCGPKSVPILFKMH